MEREVKVFLFWEILGVLLGYRTLKVEGRTYRSDRVTEFLLWKPETEQQSDAAYELCREELRDTFVCLKDEKFVSLLAEIASAIGADLGSPKCRSFIRVSPSVSAKIPWNIRKTVFVMDSVRMPHVTLLKTDGNVPATERHGG